MKFLIKAKKTVMGVYSILTGRGGAFHTEEERLIRTYYSQQTESHPEPGIVVMVDGRTMHGGLSDRLRGIATVFDFCTKYNVPFHLHFTYPFRLEDYLAPNETDWTIDDAQISYHPLEAMPVLLMLHLLPHKLHHFYLKRVWKHHQDKQLHVYTNTHFADNRYSQNFSRLFRPVPMLQQAVEKELREIGSPFTAMVLRFQQLLGDFKEGDYKILPANERAQLMERCLKKVDELHTQQGAEGRVLITSDSRTFLEEAHHRFPYVHIITGEVVHMDYTLDAAYNTYLKSFVDMLTLSHAEKVYLLKTDDMYKSGFAYRSAAIRNVPYEYVEF